MSNLKSLFLKDIDLKSGIVTYNDFEIDSNVSFEQQKWSFKEDILQIDFNKKYLIDIGWYPEFDSAGFFAVEVIENFDWSNPIFEKKCKDVASLKKHLQEAINFVCDS